MSKKSNQLSDKKFAKALVSAESNCYSMNLSQLKEFKKHINEVLKQEITERKIEQRFDRQLKKAGVILDDDV